MTYFSSVLPCKGCHTLSGVDSLGDLPIIGQKVGVDPINEFSTFPVSDRVLTSHERYDTQYSHEVPHRSTDWANTCLTSEIRRDLVLSRMHGRTSWDGN